MNQKKAQKEQYKIWKNVKERSLKWFHNLMNLGSKEKVQIFKQFQLEFEGSEAEIMPNLGSPRAIAFVSNIYYVSRISKLSIHNMIFSEAAVVLKSLENSSYIILFLPGFGTNSGRVHAPSSEFSIFKEEAYKKFGKENIPIFYTLKRASDSKKRDLALTVLKVLKKEKMITNGLSKIFNEALDNFSREAEFIGFAIGYDFIDIKSDLKNTVGTRFFEKPSPIFQHKNSVVIIDPSMTEGAN